MKIYLTDQTKRFKNHLEYFKQKDVMGYDVSRLKESNTSIVLNTNKRIDQLSLDFLFDYKVFPDNILTYKTQWSEENRAMAIGDTIVQQVYIPPIKSFSKKLIFGVRINEIIDTKEVKGFSYETLDGHVEKGVSTFTIEQEDSKLKFSIHTFSSPGNFISKLLGPIFSIPYQTYCTKAALMNVKEQIECQSNNG